MRFDGSKACMAIEGETHTEVFREHVHKVLVLILQPGDFVEMENLLRNRSVELVQLMTEVGAEVLLLMVYSQDPDPIKRM